MFRVHKEDRALKVLKEHKVSREYKEHKVHKEFKVHRVHKGIKVMMETLVELLLIILSTLQLHQVILVLVS